MRCEELQLELSTTQRARTPNHFQSAIPQSQACPAAPTQNVPPWNKGTEIERIMAKIEQDNKILAELEHSRSTTLGKFNKIIFGKGLFIYEPIHNWIGATEIAVISRKVY